MRFGAFFVGLCMLVIAASLGAVAYLALELSALESLASAITALSLLTAYNAFAGRARERLDIAQRITDLSRGTAELARQVGEQGRRIAAAEAQLNQAAERTQAEATNPLASEIEVLGMLVKQLAESVATHERMLIGATPSPPLSPAAPPRGEMDVAAKEASGAAKEAGGAADEPASPPPATETPPGSASTMVGMVRKALEGNRLDLHLQPIVTLPQRKVRFYEATTRLRTEDGTVLLPADYLRPAESGGLMPLLDNLMLFRSVQVVRRLAHKNREVGLFCNIASSTLADAEFFPQFFEFMSAHRALAPSIVFEFTQASLRAMGPIESEGLAQLRDLGFRFSLDQVNDLQFEPRALAELGFRYVKVPAALLLNTATVTAAGIHSSDFANLLARYGVDLIAEKIETESAVIDLLDYEVRFAQGFLFAPPRPVRGEVFQPPAERAAPVVAVNAAVPPRLTAVPPAAAVPATGATLTSTSTSAQPDRSGLVKLARAFGRKV